MNPLIEKYLKQKSAKDLSVRRLGPEQAQSDLNPVELLDSDMPAKVVDVPVPRSFFDPLGAPAAVPAVPSGSRNPLKPSTTQSAPSPIKSTAVRDYLMGKLNGPPRDGSALERAGNLDTIANAGASIANIGLARVGLGPNAKGTNFLETAKAVDAADVKGEGEQNDIAGKMYGQELAAEGRAAGDENADLERLRKEAADKQAAADKEKDRALKAKLQAEAEAAKAELAKAASTKKGAGAGGGKAKADAKAAAQKLKDATGLAYGYEILDGAHPSKKQLEDHAERVGAAASMKGITKEMRGLLTDSNAFSRLAPGTVKSLMDQLSQEATLEGKTIGQLGALSGPDMGIMESIVTNPARASSMTKDVARILDGVDQWVDRREGSAANAIGVRRKQAAAAAPKASGGGKVTVSNGKETFRISADHVADAEKDGFKVIQ